jgi:uncharacterized cupin superfamily protein
MGVSVREIEPGNACTHRHFHRVEEEWAYVLSGTGVVRIGPHRIEVRPGHFVGLPPGPRPHHFLATGSDLLVVLEGGERCPSEETVVYPDLGLVWDGRKAEPPSEPLPVEEGDPAQCVHLEECSPRNFQHDVDASARLVARSLHNATGLTRQAVRWAEVSSGDRSTAYHTHDRTDEWIYILEGRASARVGEVRFDVSSGDFLGHPAGGPPHFMEPETDLTYLMGGMIDPEDTVLYPDAGVRRHRGRLEPID